MNPDWTIVKCPKCDGYGQVWATNLFFDERETIYAGWGVGTFSDGVKRFSSSTSDHLVTCPFCKGARRVAMRPVQEGEGEA